MCGDVPGQHCLLHAGCASGPKSLADLRSRPERRICAAPGAAQALRQNALFSLVDVRTCAGTFGAALAHSPIGAPPAPAAGARRTGISMGRFHLLPRDESFIPLFVQAAENVASGATVLFELMSSFEHVEQGTSRMEELEHIGDQLTHDISDTLNRAFVTPFDREDIAALAAALDDVLDDAEEAARRVATYRIQRPTQLGQDLSRVLHRQCRHIAEAMPLLDRPREGSKLRSHLVELHRLENEADVLLNQALGGLYTGVTEVPQLIAAIQWGDIYSLLERATDRAERVAVVLETVLVKRG